MMIPVFVLSARAQGSSDIGTYYQAADGKKGAELKTALFQIISPHEVVTYTPGVWEAINAIDIRDDGSIWDIYSDISSFTPKTDQDHGAEVDGEGMVYNREHIIPKSWFNEGSGATDYPMYSDIHHLFPTDRFVNAMRSNYPFGEVDKSTDPTKQSADGFSKFGIADPSLGYVLTNGKARVFEPNDEFKGDIARVCFYMATAYEAYKTSGGKDRSPEDWDHSDKTMLDGTVYPFFKPWALTMLLRWAWQDPVSEKEIQRNEGIYGIQKNRNPFVDYPRLEQYIWGAYVDEAFSYNNYIEPETTGISTLHKASAPDTQPLYNLQGQRVDHPKKGEYIKQGKKVLVRE